MEYTYKGNTIRRIRGAYYVNGPLYKNQMFPTINIRDTRRLIDYLTAKHVTGETIDGTA